MLSGLFIYPKEIVRLLYRSNVACILENARGQILLGERRDVAGCLQFPQGGVQNGEELENALYREVEEEVLLPACYYYIHRSKGPYHYQFPTASRHSRGWIIGQRQHYFHVLLITEEVPLKMWDTSHEFRALRWISPDEFQLKWIPPMKWEVYTQVFWDFFKRTLS